MSDRTLAIVVGFLIWAGGLAVVVVGWLEDIFFLIAFGAAIAIVGGTLNRYSRRLSKVENA